MVSSPGPDGRKYPPKGGVVFDEGCLWPKRLRISEIGRASCRERVLVAV